MYNLWVNSPPSENFWVHTW